MRLEIVLSQLCSTKRSFLIGSKTAKIITFSETKSKFAASPEAQFTCSRIGLCFPPPTVNDVAAARTILQSSLTRAHVYPIVSVCLHTERCD